MAAAVNNTVCGVGVAFRANLAAVRLVSEKTDDITEALGLTFRKDAIGVVSCSWGPEDTGI